MGCMDGPHGGKVCVCVAGQESTEYLSSTSAGENDQMVSVPESEPMAVQNVTTSSQPLLRGATRGSCPAGSFPMKGGCCSMKPCTDSSPSSRECGDGPYAGACMDGPHGGKVCVCVAGQESTESLAATSAGENDKMVSVPESEPTAVHNLTTSSRPLLRGASRGSCPAGSFPMKGGCCSMKPCTD